MRVRALTTAAAAAGVMMLGMAPAGAATLAPTGDLGADISWPQCSDASVGPAGAYFGIVGVDDGRPYDTGNPCLATELAWQASTTAAQPVRVYANTADPGNTSPNWPTANPSGVSTPYGPCQSTRSRGRTVGADSQACAWVYGYDAGKDAERYLASKYTLTSSPWWWLDVETGNTWQTRKLQDLNQAVLLGMVHALPAGQVGAYSTNYQWNKILGRLTDPALSVLGALPEWIPTGLGVPSPSVEATNCGDRQLYPNFTGATVPQYMQYSGTYNGVTYDYDYAC